jgi:hypothetical protein
MKIEGKNGHDLRIKKAFPEMNLSGMPSAFSAPSAVKY